ncbi:UNVERIFIED_CONTAM: hypothetical protein RF653_05955 [Kocuria sp. CPCC 205316]
MGRLLMMCGVVGYLGAVMIEDLFLDVQAEEEPVSSWAPADRSE